MASGEECALHIEFRGERVDVLYRGDRICIERLSDDDGSNGHDDEEESIRPPVGTLIEHLAEHLRAEPGISQLKLTTSEAIDLDEVMSYVARTNLSRLTIVQDLDNE